MGELPREVFESASIDGASPVTAFFRLALPMTVPAIAALAIFQFLFVWNDLLVALIYIGAQNPDNAPLTIVVSNLVSSLWRRLAIPRRRGLRHDGPATRGLLRAAALLRARHRGRLRQGVSRDGRRAMPTAVGPRLFHAGDRACRDPVTIHGTNFAVQ